MLTYIIYIVSCCWHHVRVNIVCRQLSKLPKSCLISVRFRPRLCCTSFCSARSSNSTIQVVAHLNCWCIRPWYSTVRDIPWHCIWHLALATSYVPVLMSINSNVYTLVRIILIVNSASSCWNSVQFSLFIGNLRLRIETASSPISTV